MMLQITHKVHLVVYLIDNITGFSVTDPASFFIGETRIGGIQKGGGMHVFVGIPKGNVSMNVRVFGYEDGVIETEISDEAPKEVILLLIPNQQYVGTYTVIAGVKKGIKSIEAVSMKGEVCRYKGMDESKRLVTISNQQGRNLKEEAYALIHEESVSYEVLHLIKHVDDESIQIREMPKKKYFPGDKINRICIGRVFEDGRYELKLADVENVTCIIRYSDEEGEHFKRMNDKEVQGFQL